MASVHVEFGPPLFPLARAQLRESETLTSSATNIVSSESALENEVVTVTATGGNVYIAFGPTPDAMLQPRRLLCAGMPRDFSVNAGDKIAITDAA